MSKRQAGGERNKKLLKRTSGAKGYHQFGSFGFQQAPFPSGSCPGSNGVTFAPTNSKSVWTTHDRNYLAEGVLMMTV